MPPRKPAPENTESAEGTVAPETAISEAIARMKELDNQLKDIPRPKTLVGKLAVITALISRVPKSGYNDFHKYKYVQEADLVDLIRPLLSYYSIWIHQTLFADPEKGIVAHQRLGQTKKDRDGGTSTSAETLTVLTIAYRFVDGESGEMTEPQLFIGYGDDPSDKGASKASTAAQKYFLMRSLMVSTGDDPEGDTRADERASRRERSSAPAVNVQRGQGAQPAPGGRQAAASNPQIKTLGELARKAGIVSAMDLITLFERILDPAKVAPLDPEDIPGSLALWMTKQDGPTIGRLVHEVRLLAEAGDEPSQTTEVAAPAEATDDDGITDLMLDDQKGQILEEDAAVDPDLATDEGVE